MRLGIGMRWWLALAFGAVAALTAVVGAELINRNSEEAFRERAQDVTAGRAVRVAIDLAGVSGAGLQQTVRELAFEQRLSLFVFNGDGDLLSAPRSRGVDLEALTEWEEGVSAALADRRFVRTSDTLGATVVALPLGGPGPEALLVRADHPDVAAEFGIVEEEVVEAALVALVAGAVVGFLIAGLIASRIGRIGRAAASIAAGDFDRELRPSFRDEVGRLALTIDRMRRQLRASFARVESERGRLEGVLERLHQGVVSVDQDLRVEFVNRAARELLGEPVREGDLLPDAWRDSSLAHLVEQLFEEEGEVAEARVVTADERVYAVVGVPVRAEEGRAILVLTDVTERERQERAEREFVQNAAHELRTPLTTIRAAVEALEAGLKDLPEERDHLLRHLDRESERLVQLIRSLLVLARAEALQEPPPLEPVEVRALLERVVEGIVPAPGVEVAIDCPPDLFVRANRELVGDAIGNLAANSARYTREGSIELAARPIGGGRVAIEVRDTGRGFDAGDARRIYDRFYRAAGRGTDGFGLGLSIVRQAVRTLGGTVEIESEPGVGTRAVVVLGSPNGTWQ
jgi:two-component system sensor histidine kinase VicK